MDKNNIYRGIWVAAGLGIGWLVLKYLLPVLLPFGAGLLLALGAEPAAGWANRKLRLPRWVSAGLGVSLTLLILIGLVGLLGLLGAKALSQLAGRLPDLGNAAAQLQQTLRSSAEHLPESIRPLADRAVDGLTVSGNQFLSQAGQKLPGFLSALVGWVSEGALGVGTGVFSAFLFSARLPKIKSLPKTYIPESLREKLLPALGRGKTAFLGWLKAQCKLCGITFCFLLAGFLLLKIPYAPLWAAAVAVVDAIPILGTGTVLLPWALVCLLQHNHLRSVGLLCLYGAAALTRTVLEPRLVGRQLGLDPLVTLLSLYVGFRFWGILGMLLAPMLAAGVAAALSVKSASS